MPFVSLVSLLLVTGVVGLLLFNTSMQQSSFVATSMEEQATVLAAKEESLQMQLEQLRDPQRVATRAKRMGMVPASSPAFIRLSDGEIVGKPLPAEPADGMRINPLPTAKPKSLRPDPVIVEIEQPKAVRKADRKSDRAEAASANRDDAERGNRDEAREAGTKKQKPQQSQGRTR